MNKKKPLMTLALASVLTLVATTGVYAADTTRLSGNDRYETGIAITKNNWTTSDNVFISTGEGDDNFADALAGTPLAYALNAPILLSGKSSTPNAVLNQIKSMNVKNIYVLGGTGVLSDAVKNSFAKDGYNVERLYGQDRYETAAQIGEALRKQKPVTKVFLTTAYEFQYALTIAPYTAQQNAAILFTDGNTLNPTTKNALIKWGIKNVEIVGGTKIVPSSTETELNGMGIEVSRIDGNTPNEAVLNILNKYGKDATSITVANGSLYADTLSGAVVAAKNNSPIILSDKDSIDPAIDSALDKLNIKKAYVYGGTGVISDSLFEKIKGKGTGVNNSTNNISTGSTVYDPNKNPADVITLPDKTIEAAAKQYLGKDTITVADAKTVEGLFLTDTSNLDGIQYFSNLKALNITNGTDLDLSKISNLTNLNELQINNSSIESLKGVENLKNLTKLDIVGCHNLKDISSLKGLTNLQDLLIQDTLDNQLDLNAISDLKNLKNLVLLDVYAKNTNVIGNLTQLQILMLKNIKADETWHSISDISFVSNLIGLNELDVSNNLDITDISPVKNLTNIKFLTFSGTAVKDFSSLINLNNLQSISTPSYGYVTDESRSLLDQWRNKGLDVSY